MVNSDAPKGKFMLYNGGVTLAKNPVIRFVVICKTHAVAIIQVIMATVKQTLVIQFSREGCH
jgi:hypothetical protein